MFDKYRTFMAYIDRSSWIRIIFSIYLKFPILFQSIRRNFNELYSYADVLSAIFVNVVKSEEESVRLRLLKFIQLHVRDIPVHLMNEDLMLSIEHHIREVIIFSFLSTNMDFVLSDHFYIVN